MKVLDMNDVVADMALFCRDCLKDADERNVLPEATKAFEKLCSSQNINQFARAIKVFADEECAINVELYADNSRQMTEQDCSNKIKGDLFEIFTYIYLKEHNEEVFGVKFAPYDQKGWDFEATNNVGNKCLIQSKYVAAGEYDGDLGTFFGEGHFMEGVVNLGDGSLSGILFTTAEKVSRRIKDYSYDHNSFKIIDRKHLKKKDFPGFWKVVNRVLKEELFMACDFNNKEL